MCACHRAQICRRIARAMGGDLTAASEGLGRGTTLTFSIPLCVPAAGDAAAAAAAEEEGGQSSSGGGGGVPVVDFPAAAAAAAAAAATAAAASGASRDSGCAAALPPLPARDDTHPADASDAAAPPSLPAAPPAPWPPPPPSPSPSPPASPSSPVAPPIAPPRGGVNVNVLVAEDDALSQVVMRKLLSALRLRFTLVANGAAAVEAYKHGARARGAWRCMRAAAHGFLTHAPSCFFPAISFFFLSRRRV
jgi:hypothetical protein